MPEAVLTNADLEKLVETNDEWIAARTGIRQRHILAEGEMLSDHAAVAAQRALDMAGVDASEVDLVLLATSSPDDLFGSACQVRGREKMAVHGARLAAVTWAEAPVPRAGRDRAGRVVVVARRRLRSRRATQDHVNGALEGCARR